MKKTVSLILCFLMMFISVPAAFGASPSTKVWTGSALERFFKDSYMPPGANRTITFHAAQNEYESYQILIRSRDAFTTTGVSFTNLVNGSKKIDAGNLSYRFQDYMHFNNYGNIDWPDPLSNNAVQMAEADTTQGIWVTVYVPKDAAAGDYKGKATVHTTAGDFPVDIKLTVYDVQIPDTKDGAFSYGTWNTLALRWADHSLETSDYIKEQYGYEPFSEEWWNLIGKMADNMRETKQSMVTVPLDLILFGEGTALDDQGTYTFGWDKFDRFVQSFVDQGNIKILRGFSLLEAIWDNPRVFVIEKDAQGQLTIRHEDVGSQPANNFLDQMLPALKAHLDEKGWTQMWRQSISDEAHNGDTYAYAVNKLRQYFGDSVKTIDAFLDQHDPYVGNVHTWIPITNYYQDNQAFFNSRIAAGEEVWTYVCIVPLPSDGWMNRFVDSPPVDPRLLIWGNFKYGLNGFYHWGYNYWNTTDGFGLNPESLGPWGDGFIIYPDKENASVKTSVRGYATRDGIEDYEIFNMLKQTSPDLAQSIVDSVVQGFNRYSKDPNLVLAKRIELLKAAAALPQVAGKYEAEAAQITGGEVGTYGSGYSGDGYVRVINALGDKVTFTVNAPSTGDYKLIVKYSNGMGKDQSLGLLVNGEFVNNTVYPQTGSWDTTWSTKTEDIRLGAGDNAVEFKFLSGNGFVDIDYIALYKIGKGTKH